MSDRARCRALPNHSFRVPGTGLERRNDQRPALAEPRTRASQDHRGLRAAFLNSACCSHSAGGSGPGGRSRGLAAGPAFGAPLLCGGGDPTAWADAERSAASNSADDDRAPQSIRLPDEAAGEKRCASTARKDPCQQPAPPHLSRTRGITQGFEIERPKSQARLLVVA
jgi:hypothetical protein